MAQRLLNFEYSSVILLLALRRECADLEAKAAGAATALEVASRRRSWEYFIVGLAQRDSP